MNPRRRQELALGVVGAVLGLGIVAGIAAIVRARRRARAT
jgi:hypothetical protein